MSDNENLARVAQSPKEPPQGECREVGRLATGSLSLRYEYGKAYWAALTDEEIAELPANVRRVVSEWEAIA